MSNLPTATPLSDADYDMIESAVMETVRGRWFLAEHARRNRHADTNLLLAAIDRLETNIRGGQMAQPVDRIRFDLFEMAKSIARTKAEIADLKPCGEHQGKFGEATGELDSIIRATEAATCEILATAEQVQEIAWTLREHGVKAATCDMLDTMATAIYTACTFQDLTGQRTSKVIQVLRYLEDRINALIDGWGFGSTTSAEVQPEPAGAKGAAAFPDPLAGGALDQADIDMVMAPATDARRPYPASRGAATDVAAQSAQAEPEAMDHSALKMGRAIGLSPHPDAGTVRGEGRLVPRTLPVDTATGSAESIRAEEMDDGVGGPAYLAGAPSKPESDQQVRFLELEPDPAPAVPAAELLSPPYDRVGTAEITAPDREEVGAGSGARALAIPGGNSIPGIKSNAAAIATAALDRLDALSPEEKIALFS